MGIRVVCSCWPHQVSMYEMQVLSKRGNWVTVGARLSLLEMVHAYGTAVMDEYDMVKVVR